MLKIFATVYAQPNHEGYAGEMGRMLGYTGKNTSGALNSTTGKFGRKLIDAYNLQPMVHRSGKPLPWYTVFDGEEGARGFLWRMRPELARAFGASYGMRAMAYPDETSADDAQRFPEGTLTRVLVNAYERNPAARRACLAHYGYACCVCNMDFERSYGIHGKEFIHVHHLVPLATIGDAYEIDPIEDMRPVCPNCHAMLHRPDPKRPLPIEGLKNIIAQRTKTADNG